MQATATRRIMESGNFIQIMDWVRKINRAEEIQEGF
jgi:hypothetical protein